MSDRDKKLLVYLGALIILACTYFFFGKPYLDKIDKLSNEKMSLEQTLKKKEASAEKQDDYLKGIDEAKASFQKIFDEFPEDITDEQSIMFASHAEVDMPMWFSQIKFADVEKTMLGDDEEAATQEEGEEAEQSTESSEDKEDSEPKEKASLLEGLMWKRVDLGLSFATKYDGYKKFLEYIRDYEDRIVIKEIDVQYDKLSGLVSGTVILSQYAVLGDDRVLPEVKTDVKDIGTKNIFVNENHGGSIVDLLADVMADFIEAILGENAQEIISSVESSDYFVKLNAVTDNTNGKTAGRSDDVIGATYVTSDKNASENVLFNISGSNGKYKITYSVGGHGYSDEITKESDENISIRIISTERYSKDDDVAGKVHIINKSDIPVNVTVEGDDSSKPRVDIVEKSGDVTIK